MVSFPLAVMSLSGPELIGILFGVLTVGFAAGWIAARSLNGAKPAGELAPGELKRRALGDLRTARMSCQKLAFTPGGVDSVTLDAVEGGVGRLRELVDRLRGHGASGGTAPDGIRWIRRPVGEATGLPTRPTLNENVDRLLHACGDGSDAGLLLAEIDRVGDLSVRFGPRAVPELTLEFLSLLHATLGDHDLLIEAGPGRFWALLVPGETPVRERIETARETIRQHAFVVDDREIMVTASFGWTAAWDRATRTEWIDRSETALTTARQRGRNQLAESR